MTNRPGRFTKATVEGVTYDIPEYWLIGMRQQGISIENAIGYWHYQSQLGEADK